MEWFLNQENEIQNAMALLKRFQIQHLIEVEVKVETIMFRRFKKL